MQYPEITTFHDWGSRKGGMRLLDWVVSEGGSEDDDGEVGMGGGNEEGGRAIRRAGIGLGRCGR